MSATNDPAATALPWIAMWLKPRLAIDRVIATKPRLVVLALAALAMSSQAVAQLILATSMNALRDWRLIVAGASLGAVAGIVNLYVSALVVGWTARLFRGRAPGSSVRAAMAWGGGPISIGLPIVLVAIFMIWLTGTVSESELVIVLDVLTIVLVIWALVVTVAMFACIEGFSLPRAISCLVVACLFGAVVLALIVRTFLFQSFNIPSGSMQPTLLVGDYLFVSKYAYGYSRYSLPFSVPLFGGRRLGSDPERGDVVVFRSPKDVSVDFIKRIVGLPGDKIQMINGLLHINGMPVQRERIGDFVMVEDGRTNRVKRWRETLPNGVSFETLDLVENGFYDNTQVYDVPAGHVFVMGDNLDNSTDSRVLSQIGYVPIDNLVGRAAMIFYSVDKSQGKREAIRIERIGMIVR